MGRHKIFAAMACKVVFFMLFAILSAHANTPEARARDAAIKKINKAVESQDYMGVKFGKGPGENWAKEDWLDWGTCRGLVNAGDSPWGAILRPLCGMEMPLHALEAM